MSRLGLVAALCALGLIATVAHAQQMDFAFGVGTLTSPSASSATGNYSPVTMSGGTYLSFSGDVLIKREFGVNGEVAWRASQAVYRGIQPYRPILYDFNAIWAPRLGKHAAAEVMGGIGGVSIRFYTPFVTCNGFTCTNYVSSQHFLVHAGGGLKFYASRSIFIRPEFHAYFINNNFEFSSGRAFREGVSIGYTFRPSGMRLKGILRLRPGGSAVVAKGMPRFARHDK